MLSFKLPIYRTDILSSQYSSFVGMSCLLISCQQWPAIGARRSFAASAPAILPAGRALASERGCARASDETHVPASPATTDPPGASTPHDGAPVLSRGCLLPDPASGGKRWWREPGLPRRPGAATPPPCLKRRWRWESGVLPSLACRWPGLLRSIVPPASRSWLDVTAFLFHSQHQGRLQADGRSLLPEQAWLDVPDQKRHVASRNVHRCLTIGRNARCLFPDGSLS